MEAKCEILKPERKIISSPENINQLDTRGVLGKAPERGNFVFVTHFIFAWEIVL